MKPAVDRAQYYSGKYHFPDSRIGASLKRKLARVVKLYHSPTSPIRESGPH